MVAKFLVAGTRGGGDLLPSLQGRVVGTLAGVWAELGLALRSIVICCDLALILKLLTCFVLLNASFFRKETSKVVKWILISCVH